MARIGTLWREVKTKYLTIVSRMDPQAAAMPAAAAVLTSIDYHAEHFDETPALIAVCYSSQPVPRNVRVIASLIRDLGLGFMLNAARKRNVLMAQASSCYPGAQNLLLAARALGLAANLTVWHMFEEKKFKQALGVPNDVTIYALIPVGWPAGNFGPVRRRPVSEVLHWDRW
jgi:nitroreductase